MILDGHKHSQEVESVLMETSAVSVVIYSGLVADVFMSPWRWLTVLNALDSSCLTAPCVSNVVVSCSWVDKCVCIASSLTDVNGTEFQCEG